MLSCSYYLDVKQWFSQINVVCYYVPTANDLNFWSFFCHSWKSWYLLGGLICLLVTLVGASIWSFWGITLVISSWLLGVQLVTLSVSSPSLLARLYRQGLPTSFQLASSGGKHIPNAHPQVVIRSTGRELVVLIKSSSTIRLSKITRGLTIGLLSNGGN